MQDNLLVMKDIVKTYSGTVALNHMQLTVRRGTVHALLGENGAGKSTLIKTLAGAIRPDSGTIEYEGQTYQGFEPKQALELGIGVVYQEFNLVPYLTVADNMFLGNEPVKGIHLDRKQYYKKAKEIFEMLGVDVDVKAQVKNLPVAYQQMVEIAKTASKQVKLLILDEPTAALSDSEVNALFQLIRRLKKQGVSIIYISHRMEELDEIADDVTILRDGEYVETLPIGSCTREQLIAKMVGRELGKQFPQGHFGTDKVVLKVEHLQNSYVKDVSFELHEGEILGFGGLVGAGRTEVARAIFGADYATGKIEVMGKAVTIRSPREAIQNGIAFITENRKTEGLILKRSIRENITISSLDKVIRHKPTIHKKEEIKLAQEYADKLKTKCAGLEYLVSSLSGGNQQKVVLAKWLLTDSKIIIFDEPTRGIDIGVKQEIYQIMKDLAKQGISIIMISSEMPELIGISDRIIIMRHGKIAGEVNSEDCTQEQILDIALHED
ncbi:MAG: sugar ABC transporter ATP-binding protein [Faecalicatena sp.]|uniref:sugar ABC transporter ATP-binding protein n=1 Tax=Faecalicatena sp. TaxID=2005360 RepID=UPI0025905B99|nr:sugar ABC transporter ATP-binding protein [Faecalicatena sp.]MCI6467495.1 sugar ABC transporter ATP-binding protein [Faecalicatena sp.]MDY5620993.1 sugar ABC transporter ATP-binding protein [Lachnospiraceae bacterium]